jgi:acyl carrier protein
LITQAQAQQVIFDALGRLNRERPADDQIAVSLDTPLLRDDASLDSLGLVFLITEIEETLKQDFGVNVSLVSEESFTGSDSPFRTAGTLLTLILHLAGPR